MADFYQSGVVATMHRLGGFKIEIIEKQLESYSRTRPIALVLPCLYSELDGPALGPIVQELRRVKYLRQIVVSLARANYNEFQRAQEFFGVLPQETILVWNDGERVSRLRQVLESHRLKFGPDGKGRGAWMAYRYVLGSRKAEVIALHDCDIV